MPVIARTVAPEQDDNQLDSQHSQNDKRPLLASTMSDESPSRSSSRRLVAIGSVVVAVALAVAGTAAVVHARQSYGKDMATTSDLSESTGLWESFGSMGSGGWSGGWSGAWGSKGNTVCGWNPAGGCDCTWATGGIDGSCSRRAQDNSQCWSCCCRSYFHDDYHRIMDARHQHWEDHEDGMHDDHYHYHHFDDVNGDHHHVDDHYHHFDDVNGDHHHHHENADHFHHGDEVLVQQRSGYWKPATVIRSVGMNHLKLRYDGGNFDTVRCDRVVHDEHPIFNWWLQVLIWLCLCLCLCGIIFAIFKALTKPSSDDAYEPQVAVIEEPKPDRSCTWCGGN